jgi:formate hydrogenlyase subunit 3/multisubunit Na+/H+ antiporter MnhD subunit
MMNLIAIPLIAGAISILISVYWKKAGLLIMAMASVSFILVEFRPGVLISYFSLIASLVFIITSVYTVRYSEKYGRWLTPLFLFTIEGMFIILSSGNYLELIAGWEIMSIPAYATVALNRDDSAPSYVFMVFSEISTIFLVIAAVVSYSYSGGLTLSFVNSGPVVLLLLAIGAMTKMGITPFMISEWLPIAHGNAPANSSAIFSAGMTLMGVFIIVRLAIATSPSLMLGLLFMAVGGISVMFAALYAYVSENMKMLGGFSTIENNGAILVAIGLYVALPESLPIFREFMIIVVVIYSLAHSVAKTGLFLAIGSTDSETFSGVKDRKNLNSSIGTLLIVISLSGLFPTIGGLATWMLLEALFMGAYNGGVLGIASIIAGGVIAIGEGLASGAMLKVISFTQAYKKRGESRDHYLTNTVLFVGILLVLLMAVSTLLIPSYFLTGNPAVLVFNGFTIQSSFGDGTFGVISPLYIIGIIVLFSLVARLVMGKPSGGRKVRRWNGGITEESSYNSFTYSNNMRMMLRKILRTSYQGERRMLTITDVFWFSMISVSRLYRKFSRAITYGLMNSSIGWYMIYMIVGFMVILIIAAL